MQKIRHFQEPCQQKIHIEHIKIVVYGGRRAMRMEYREKKTFSKGMTDTSQEGIERPLSML